MNDRSEESDAFLGSENLLSRNTEEHVPPPNSSRE